MLLGRYSRRTIATFAALLTTTALFWFRWQPTQTIFRLSSARDSRPESLAVPSCRGLPGANDTVVVLKTGSTELEDKLPVHLKTTLSCYENHLIFSDFAELYQDEIILDALEDVDPTIKGTHPDFALYRQLQQSGRASLDPSQLSGPRSLPPDDTSGKASNPGWKLDKWKFLPMIRKTLQEYPDKKWYVFVETDTYALWSTLLNYLAALDSSKQHYIGNQMQIGDILFAHGGSGFVISRPALEMAVAQYTENKAHWEDFTANHWAGDCVLGKVLKDSGTSVVWAWPIWQGANFGDLDYERVDYGHTLWCAPTVSYHHLTPSVVEDLWVFEQDWVSKRQGNHSLTLRHHDIYAGYILPRILTPKSDWDNYSGDDKGTVSSLEDCRELCNNELSCVQYSLNYDSSRCSTSSQPKYGEASLGTVWLDIRANERLSRQAKVLHRRGLDNMRDEQSTWQHLPRFDISVFSIAIGSCQANNCRNQTHTERFWTNEEPCHSVVNGQDPVK